GVFPSQIVMPSGSKFLWEMTKASAQASSMSPPMSVSRMTFIFSGSVAGPASLLISLPANSTAQPTVGSTNHFFTFASSCHNLMEFGHSQSEPYLHRPSLDFAHPQSRSICSRCVAGGPLTDPMDIIELIRHCAAVPSFSTFEDRLHPLIKRIVATVDVANL